MLNNATASVLPGAVVSPFVSECFLFMMKVTVFDKSIFVDAMTRFLGFLLKSQMILMRIY